MTPFLDPTFIISILIALSVHEWAHGYIAYKLGDPTAEHMGRLTLNPLAHLDPLGTLLFVLVGFGWGKPVPINPSYFKSPRRDTALVSIAGPISNLILAFLSFIGLAVIARIVGSTSPLLVSQGGPVVTQFFTMLFSSSLFLNLALMAFNLLPIAPLDGSKILAAFLPAHLEDRYNELMRYGAYILLGVLLLERIFGIPILSAWIGWITTGVLTVFLLPFGQSL